MKLINFLTEKDMSSLFGSGFHYVPVYDENGNVISWRIVYDEEEPINNRITPIDSEEN